MSVLVLSRGNTLAWLDLCNSVHTGVVVAMGNGTITTVEGDIGAADEGDVGDLQPVVRRMRSALRSAGVRPACWR